MSTVTMKRINWTVLAVAGLCIAAAPGMRQESEPQFTPTSIIGVGFTLEGRVGTSDLVWSNIVASPSWSPSESLPFSPGRAVDVARAELRKVVDDEPSWYTQDIMLKSLANYPPSHPDAWYYAIRFQRKPPVKKKPIESVVVCIDFSGTPGAFNFQTPRRF